MTHTKFSCQACQQEVCGGEEATTEFVADIIAFRNVIVHEYFGLSWTLVWETATRDVPDLHRQIVEILRSEFPGSGGSN